MTRATSEITPTIIKRLQGGVVAGTALLAGMKLELFTLLAEAPATAATLALRLGVREDKLAPLLYALAVTELLQVSDGCFANSPEAEALLVKGRPRYMGDVHNTWSEVWHANLQTADSIRSGRPQAKHDFSAAPAEQTAAFLRGLFPGARALGGAIAERFDLSGCTSVVDIGGGSGGTLVGLCSAYPSLTGILFDLPAVVPIAQRIVGESPLGARIRFEAGDIVKAPPRARYDAAVLCAVIQLLPPDQAALAIRHAVAGLLDGGLIVISGRGILDDTRTGPAAAVFTNLTFLNLYDEGRAYTESEYFAWLAVCNCIEARRITMPDGTQLIAARKAARP